MIKTRRGYRHTAQQTQRVPLVTAIVDLITRQIGITVHTAGGLPADLVDKAALVTQGLTAQTVAHQTVHSQHRRAGTGRVSGGRTLNLAVVVTHPQASQLDIQVLPPGHHPVAVAAVSGQHPTRVAIGHKLVRPIIGVGVGAGATHTHLSDLVEDALSPRAAAVHIVDLVVVAPGHISLPAQADLPVDGAGRQPYRGGRFGHIQAGELAVEGVVELESIPIRIAIGVQSRAGTALVHIQGVANGGQQPGVDGSQGHKGGAGEPFGSLESVLVGTRQITGVEAQRPGPADADLASGGIGGVDADLGDDRRQQGHLQAGQVGGFADSAVGPAIGIGVEGQGEVAVGDPSLEGGGVGVGSGVEGQLSNLDIAC
ncbi:hypothetical protein, partial [Spirosoma harenae]